LANIRGRIEMQDGRWTFSGLEGDNDTAHVTANGGFGPNAEGHNELHLRLEAEDVPLEEELRDAIGKPNVQQLWSDLRLKGSLEAVVLDLRYRHGGEKLDVAFSAWPKPDTVSLEPVHFPYRLDNIRGRLDFRDGRMVFDRFRAQHRETKLSAGVACDLLADGSWSLQLERMSADRLQLDRELIAALPSRIRGVIGSLHPQGPVNLSGRVQVGRGGQVDAPLNASWDLNVGLFQGSLGRAVQLKNICGAVRVTGGFDGARVFNRGELAIESLLYGDVQLTDIHGPVWLDDQRVLLGSWVDRDAKSPTAQQQPRPITAGLFGGMACLDGGVLLETIPKYSLQATLSDGDVRRCTLELGAQQQNLRGRVYASAELRGQGSSLNSLAGTGRINLRDADIYELPVMIALLKTLSLKRPDSNAFSKSDIEFRIEGPHIYLDSISFCGDAISLEGRGEMDFNRNVALTFRTILGRSDLRLPLVKDVLGGASEQIMQIHVTGSLHNPVTRRELLPALNQAFPQNLSDLQRPPADERNQPQAFKWLPDSMRLWPNKR
jgi:hypothetical protein